MNIFVSIILFYHIFCCRTDYYVAFQSGCILLFAVLLTATRHVARRVWCELKHPMLSFLFFVCLCFLRSPLSLYMPLPCPFPTSLSFHCNPAVVAGEHYTPLAGSRLRTVRVAFQALRLWIRHKFRLRRALSGWFRCIRLGLNGSSFWLL